ncbi:hypothetical protein BKA65DRAFT_282868 [Rhexocercosporidium sp. MPI-PUGE-AT-0058]|nr:hypothetical protein BKA65DRAFT_282868 [Rhexocercosporidium sp. MPI-PUGE-AT-0058]
MAQSTHENINPSIMHLSSNHLISSLSNSKGPDPATRVTPRSRKKPRMPSSTQGPRYHCPTADCTRSYKRRFELIRHQHVHTNIRVHECRFVGCHRNGDGKGFARKDHLKQHLKLVHGVSA